MKFRPLLLIFGSIWTATPYAYGCLSELFHKQIHGDQTVGAPQLPRLFLYRGKVYSTEDAIVAHLGDGVGGGDVYRVRFAGPEAETLILKFYREGEEILEDDLKAYRILKSVEHKIGAKVAMLEKTGEPGMAVVENIYGVPLHKVLASRSVDESIKKQLLDRYMKLLFDLRKAIKEAPIAGEVVIDPGLRVRGLPYLVVEKTKGVWGNAALAVHAENILVDPATYEFTINDPM